MSRLIEPTPYTHDAVVIGGGFYGAAIAIYLTRQRGFSRVTLLEQENALLMRASYHNQARVHNGYHYPRSYTTAYRSRVNQPRFVRDFSDAVQQNFIKLYAIARRNSKVTARQFTRFCQEIGARVQPAPSSLAALFDSKLIEAAFVVEERAFNAARLQSWASSELRQCGVAVKLGCRAIALHRTASMLVVDCIEDGVNHQISGRYVFNCTYSGLNQFKGAFPRTSASLKHEITEMALVEMPPALRELGVTVMDGPFFSMMPFPPRQLHTLSHVRYTPHRYWMDKAGEDPYQQLMNYGKETRVERMMRDVARYIPAIGSARYVDSLFEIKTVLMKNEVDDGRPILFERHADLTNCFSILGGKIDNIYDVLEKLDGEHLSLD